MNNNFQILQYDGSQYNQLTPNLSNISNNSNQLGGVESSQYATKEYADKNSKKLIESIRLSGNISSTQLMAPLTTTIDLSEMDALGVNIYFNQNFTLQNNHYNQLYFQVGLGEKNKDPSLYLIEVVLNTNENNIYGFTGFKRFLLFPMTYYAQNQLAVTQGTENRCQFQQFRSGYFGKIVLPAILDKENYCLNVTKTSYFSGNIDITCDFYSIIF